MTKLNTKQTLLPCPFCGEPGRWVLWRPNSRATIQCDGCGATGPLADSIDGESLAVEAWNRRGAFAEKPWLGELAERLQKCADDPLWPDRAEVLKSLLLMAISALSQPARPGAAMDVSASGGDDPHSQETTAAGESLTLIIDWMRHWGFDLGFGEPEDITPSEIIDAIKRSLPDGANHSRTDEGS